MAIIDQGIKQKESIEETPLYQLQGPQGEVGASYTEDLVRVKILLDVDRSFLIGASVKDEKRVEMLLFLMQNVDVFAWSSNELPRVDPEFIVHKVNVDPLHPPKK